MALSIPHTGSKVSQFVTASIGVATIKPHSLSKSEDLFLQADKALYQAKNQVKFAYQAC
ncbi:MAG TPA: diguanylate cyclase [Bacillus sp. (in: firmicutes)]|nr:diguanylate cyclase [Bacillus sp. (in: firmicutes)]